MIDAARHPDRYASMRRRARDAAIAIFDRASRGVPGWLALIDEVLAQPPIDAGARGGLFAAL